MPAGVFGATSTWPSALTVSGPLLFGLTVTSAGLTALPPRVSLPSTLTTLVPPVAPLTGVATMSSTASIGAASTVTTTVAVVQLAGSAISQIRYSTV